MWEDTITKDNEPLQDIHPMQEATANTEKRLAEPKKSFQFIEALKKFQKLNNLPVTGKLDDATINAMNKPRCGVPDNQVLKNIQDKPNLTKTVSETNSTKNITNQGDGAPKKRSKRFLDLLMSSDKYRKEQEASQNAGGKVFSKKLLKWRMIGEGYSNQLSISEQRYVFRLAFRMWSEVMPLDFEEDNTSPLSQIDIKLGFGRGRCAYFRSHLDVIFYFMCDRCFFFFCYCTAMFLYCTILSTGLHNFRTEPFPHHIWLALNSMPEGGLEFTL